MSAATCRPTPKQSQDDSGPKEAFTKYPMRRLELSIKKFIKVLSIDLERLRKHTNNISRLMKFEDWTGLHKEQVNATRTVQQINASIMEIEKARRQVIETDLEDFDERVNPVKTEAVTAMDELVAFIGHGPKPLSNNTTKSRDVVETGTGDVDINSLLSLEADDDQVPPIQTFTSNPKGETYQLNAISKPLTSSEENRLKGSSSKSNKDSCATWTSSAVVDQDGTDWSYSPSSPQLQDRPPVELAPLLTTSLHVAPENSEASASWEELQESILDLNTLVHEFASRVEEQGEGIDVIENHIDQAHADVVEGTSQLAKASKLKTVIFPVMGAVVGGVVGGPIGLLAGMKIGGMAGIVGGAVGLAGGSIYKKRQDEITNIEMTNMEAKRSQSMPEILDQNATDDTPTTSHSIADQSKSSSLSQMNFGKLFSYFSFSSDDAEKQ